MACFNPLAAWYSKDINESGKRSMTFNPKSALEPDKPLDLPCGQCVGCRLERSRQWAVRCMHEAQMHEQNCFLTLTFDDAHLSIREHPESLDKRDFQNFMKRLRKKFGKGIRYYHCGEYGEKYGRPHYHACIFGFDFPDKELLTIENGQRLYISEELQKLWPYGYSTIGSVTFQSAAYVARYIMKKVTGKDAIDHYTTSIDYETGEIITKQPEYTTMSLKPAIGKTWFEKYEKDVYPHDYIVVNGKKTRPPKYYDTLLDKLPLTPDRDYELSIIKDNRKELAYKHQSNNTYDRLKVREQIQNIKLKQLPRKLDGDL